MHVRMKRAFDYDVPGRAGVRREIPAGWTGDLPEDIARAAEAEGAAVLDDAATDGAPAKKRRQGKDAKSKVQGRPVAQRSPKVPAEQPPLLPPSPPSE